MDIYKYIEEVGKPHRVKPEWWEEKLCDAFYLAVVLFGVYSPKAGKVFAKFFDDHPDLTL